MTPQRYHVLFTKRAAADLEGIFRYISSHSPQNASGMIRRIADAIDSLETFPHRYPTIEPHRRTRPQTRMMPVGSYLVYYRVLENQQAVRLITVQHGARQRPSRLDE